MVLELSLGYPNSPSTAKPAPPFLGSYSALAISARREFLDYCSFRRRGRTDLEVSFLPASHTLRACGQPRREVFTTKHHQLAITERDFREQEEQDPAADYVLATSGYLHLNLCQRPANPTYRCKTSAKAHPRAKVSQTNRERLRAARKIGRLAAFCCFCAANLPDQRQTQAQAFPGVGCSRASLRQPHSQVTLQLLSSTSGNRKLTS